MICKPLGSWSSGRSYGHVEKPGAGEGDVKFAVVRRWWDPVRSERLPVTGVGPGTARKFDDMAAMR
jgi:hypothetical protein